jgi:hypothetical protein
MRIAAGIILMVLGLLGLGGLVMGLASSSGDFSLLPTVPWRILSAGLIVAAGVYCLRRRYWGMCVVSTWLALLIGIFSAVVSVVAPSLFGPVFPTWVFMVWGAWVMIAGAAVSTIFIYRRREDWQKSEASLELPNDQHLRD